MADKTIHPAIRILFACLALWIAFAATLSHPQSVFVAGHYAYVASYANNRLAILELNHLQAPTAELGSLRTGGLHVGESAIVGNQRNVLGRLNVGQSAMVNGDLIRPRECDHFDHSLSW